MTELAVPLDGQVREFGPIALRHGMYVWGADVYRIRLGGAPFPMAGNFGLTPRCWCWVSREFADTVHDSMLDRVSRKMSEWHPT